MIPENYPPFVDFIYRTLRNNRLKFTGYLIVTICCALLLSATLGQHYDGSKAHRRASIRKPRQATGPPLKDPFSSRPRIQTRNGHLVIEASQDKNIDFKTSGTRGSITINGYKLDSLLEVTKALEKSAQIVNAGTGLKQSQSGVGPYDVVLKSLFESGERFLALEKRLDNLNENISKLRKKLKGFEPKVRKKISKLADKYNTLVDVLKKNDCFDQETGQPVCKNGATCLDTFNGFKCLCPSNYEGTTCEQDVDECSKFRNTDLGCQNGAKCVNLPGSYRCECTSQYHGVHCTEQHDDCSLSSSKSLCGFGKCINLARNVPNQAHYECICDQGWTTDGVNPACVIDINECLVGQSLVNTSNSNSSPQVSAAWVNSLMAAYPCSQNPFVDCVNLPGSFQCGPCPPGYTGNGRVCRDLDECATDNGGCSTMPLVECFNTQGSRLCGPCPPGYTGDGVICSRESACTASTNGGCHPMAKCIELEGVSLSSRLCVCKYPFAGEGVGPDGCQPLPAPTGPAFGSNNGTDSLTISRVPESDCSPNPCLNMAPCQLTDSSFECLCPAGFQGRICDEQVPVCGGRFFFSKGSMVFPLGGSFTELVKMNSDSSSSANFKSAPALSERHYNCNWSITVSNNMSMELLFSELTNKLNPSKQVQLFLANTTLAHQIVAPPTCAEYLDVRERLEVPLSMVNKVDDNQQAAAASNRLLARFCTDNRPGTSMQALGPKRRVNILSESNMVDLEYSFSATRTQFGEPSLSFALSWSKVEPPCGGKLPVAEFGSLSSPKFPEFYPVGTECRYLIRVPPGKRVRIQFGELNLLTGRPHSSFCADSLTIFDGSIGSDRAVIFKHCANNSTFAARMQRSSIPPIVSSSSTVELVLDSRADSITPLMKPKQQQGFYLTYASEPASPGCGGLYTLKSGLIKSSDYEPSDQPTNSAHSRLAIQMSGFLEPIESQTPATNSPAQPLLFSLLKEENHSDLGFNSSRLARLYNTRCEYEIRPADQMRNNKISLDWLEMPSAPKPPPPPPVSPGPTRPSMESPSEGYFKRGSELKAGLLFPSRWSLLDQCAKGRLTVFDGNPSDGSDRTEIASFCSGDTYNASIHTAMKPIISSGHVLYLVYESSHKPVTSLGPNGFKLQYSTVCHAIYNQQSERINVQLDSEVDECIYHIMLPPNNTISLTIEPGLSYSTGLLAPDGGCSAQAVFLDGAVQWNLGKQALLAAERQLKTYRFLESAGQSSSAAGSSNQATRAGNTVDVVGGDATTGPTVWQSEAQADSYWQYSSSQVHDMKEFEVCRLPALSFDSIWNHLSLLFRLKPRPISSDNYGRSTKAAGSKVQLTVRYQAEPACGGIITEPSGSIKLEQSRRITSLNSFPITAEQYERLHKQQFVNPCAWVLQSAPNKVVQLNFEAPAAEINKRYSEWLNWSQKIAKQSNSPPIEFNCSQVFQESIELYEPSLNRTRHLCPNELPDSNQTRHSWNTQSNIVFIRLHNSTLESGNVTVSSNGSSATINASSPIWPGRRPLGGPAIVVKYKFVSSMSGQCGGRLLRNSGTIQSPRYPYNYPPRLNCTWIIRADSKQQVRLNFTKFELENPSGEGCVYDYLELRNGPSIDSPLIGRFCSSDLQSKVLVAHSSMVWLNFVTDRNFGRAGFEIFFDGAQTGCGGKLTTASGQIDSPNYPLSFGHRSECEWSIEVSQSNRIELTIVDLDLSSDSVNCSTSGAQADYLELIDSESKESYGRSLGKYCHKNQLVNKTTILSRGNKLYVVYRSQALDNSRGFRLTYRTNCAQIELNGLRGAIETPGYPKSYISSSNCSWFIKAPLGSNLTLAINDMEIEEFLTMTQQAELLKNPIKQAGKCEEDIAEIWALYPAAQSANYTNKSGQFELEFRPRPGYSPDATRKWMRNQGIRALQPRGGELVRTLCGRLSDLADSDRLIDMNTNMAYISFETDRYVEKRGLRIEWQARGCGGQQVGDTIQTISYHEISNSQRPTECVWTFDMFKSAMTIEFSIHSDLRSPDGNINNKIDQCDDASLTIYDGPTDQAPILSKNCDSFKVRESVITSSGQALVKFYTSGRRNYGRGFVLSGWPSSREGCLPSVFDISTDYNQQAGWRKSPNYPDLYSSNDYHCYGLLTAAKGRLRIRVEELNIPVDGREETAAASGLLSPDTCTTSNNYLLIRNMVGETVYEKFCGKLAVDSPKDMARATVVLEQETAWTEFVTKNGARGRWKFTYDRLCGSIVHADYPMELSSPNYPAKPRWPRSSRNKLDIDTYDDPTNSENVCIWRVKNTLYLRKSDPDKKLHLSIINFIESESPQDRSSDCLRIFEGADMSIRQSFFNLTAIDALYKPKVKICKQSEIKHTSLSYISQGSEVVVMITGSVIAKLRVRPFENYCGGEYHLNKAEFASLNYPQPYTADLDCHYFILSSPGSRVNLDFIAFDLPEGEPADDDTLSSDNSGDSLTDTQSQLVCDNVDHIEILQLAATRKIKARLDLVGKLVSTYSRWSEASFLILNELYSSANISEIKSASPPKPQNYSGTDLISSKLNETSKMKSSTSARLYQLAKVYHLFHEAKYRSLDSFQEQSSLALSAFYENAKLIGRFCGKKAPNFAADRILRDDILIRFRSHSPPASSPVVRSPDKQPRGFLADYKIEYGGLIQLDTSPASGEESQEGFIGSPMYPAYYRYNNSIKWNFETKLDSVIQFDLVDLDLGSVHQGCQDTVSVFDGLNPQTSIKLCEWCGHLSFKVIDKKKRLDLAPQGVNANLPIFRAFDQRVQSSLIRTIQTSANVASVIYSNFKSNGIFLLRYRAIKKSSLSQNKTSAVTDSAGDNDQAGNSDNESPIEADELLRRANDRSGFSEGRNASKFCSQTHRLSFGLDKNSSQVVLTSPNWPNAAPQDIECHWLIYTYENSNIKLAVDPTSAYISDTSSNEDQYAWTYQKSPEHCFDQRSSEKRNFIAIHDGASPLAPTIARHCLPMAPIQFQSTGKHLLIRYVNAAGAKLDKDGINDGDKAVANGAASKRDLDSLFKGVASIGGCGGQYHILNSARIRDRSTKDASYENGLSCTYYLFAANQDRVLVIINEMSDFELASEPTNSDCSVGDYIEIRDLPILNEEMDFSRSLTGRSLGRFCAGRKLEHIESPGSGLSIEFKTDSRNVAKGWELYVMSTMPKLNCPRGYIVANLDEPTGRFTSPNWPHGFSGKRHCKYHLVAPLNQTIKVTFIRLQRPLLGNKDFRAETDPIGKCADNLHYLADNEARTLRYDSRPLRQLQSPLSGTLLRQLVKEVPCSQNNLSRPSEAGSAIQAGDLEELTNGSLMTGMKKISLNEYWSFISAAPLHPFTIETDSHVLLLDYETKNLLPNEGFFAVYKTEPSRKFRCSKEITYNVDATDKDAGSNLIESYNFGVETLKTDDYIQCEWVIKSSSNFFVPDYIDLSQAVISYKMTQTNDVGIFRVSYVVFQVLEIPPAVENGSIFDDNVSRNEMSKMNDICGLSRVYMADLFSMQIMFACGNLTDKTKWTLLDYNVRQISLRSKNLRRKAQSTDVQQEASTKPVVYRGLRAYYYEKICWQVEHIIGEGILIKSHASFPNSSYSPGICRWELMLGGGDYELSFNQIQFRAPENFVNDTKKANKGCDPADADLDYIELRTSMDQDAPVLARFCIYNQLAANQKAVMLNMKSRIIVLFVAGIKTLQLGKDKFPFNKVPGPNDLDTENKPKAFDRLGFEMLIVRIKNESASEFCQQGRRQSIYSFIGNPEHDFYEVQANFQKTNFLYPKNTHCVVEMELEEGARFNMSFKTIFDLEQSKDCQNDYLQLDDLLEPPPEVAVKSITMKPVNAKSATSTRRPRSTAGTTPKADNRIQLAMNKRELVTKKIGRWCGKTKPNGYFTSATNKVRLTFHSNERIEGKGFYLEYNKIKPPEIEGFLTGSNY